MRGAKSIEIGGVRLTSPNRVLFPDQRLTKQALAEFYVTIKDWILPHVKGRPLSIVRCPSGQQSDCFYQKHLTESMPEPIRGVAIQEQSGMADYIVIDNLSGLIALVQIGTLEIHPWGARADNVEKPDVITFDLDPGDGVAWKTVLDGARALRRTLNELGLESFVKTSGGKGLHVAVPITRRHSWDEVKAFTKAVAERVAQSDAERYITKASKSLRRGKIYIDYLRNARGATAVAAYSTRAKPNAPVSTPLRWDELKDNVCSDTYRVDNLPRRLSSLKADPWEGYFELRQSITAEMKQALAMG